MAFETATWLPMMPRTITVYHYTGEDTAGLKTYSSVPILVRCYITDDVKTWRFNDEVERRSRSMVFCSDDTIGPYDKIVMPAGYDPQVPAIVWFVRADDENGYHHSEIYV